MRRTRFRRYVALAATASLVATLAAVTVGTPAAAARPRCAGKTATIVGTNSGEVILGTSGADVIVAKGGHDQIYGRGGNDTICGNRGHDRIYGGRGDDLLLGQVGRDQIHGGVGRDRLLGGPYSDSLDGGQGNDACLPGAGTGPRVNCERPVPEPPTLVIAYADVNNNHVFDGRDVMISKIIDADRSGTINAGDIILMGQYPTSPKAVTPAGVRETFEEWRVTSHTIASVIVDDATEVQVMTVTGGTHVWESLGTIDQYHESNGMPESHLSDFPLAGDTDYVVTDPASPSQPTSSLAVEAPGLGDDGFIDVDIY